MEIYTIALFSFCKILLYNARNALCISMCISSSDSLYSVWKKKHPLITTWTQILIKKKKKATTLDPALYGFSALKEMNK